MCFVVQRQTTLLCRVTILSGQVSHQASAPYVAAIHLTCLLASTDGKNYVELERSTLEHLLLPLLLKYGVNVYLAGHTHHLADMKEPGTRLRHVISGAGVKTHKLVPPSRYRVFAKVTTGLIVMKATTCALSWDIIDSAHDNEVIHSASIPNYRRGWLKQYRGIEATGECDKGNEPNMHGSRAPHPRVIGSVPTTCPDKLPPPLDHHARMTGVRPEGW